jgi:hypothetical protein
MDSMMGGHGSKGRCRFFEGCGLVFMGRGH